MSKIIKQKYSKRIMLERIIWSIIWNLTIRPFPRAKAKKWEIFVLRLLGAKIGNGCCIYSSAKIFLPRNLVMEDGATIADYTVITNAKRFVLKKYSLLSQYSTVYCGSHNIFSDEFESQGDEVVLGEYSWVAAHCYVGAGVKVGRGARVGASSAIRRNIPPYSVSYGNPIKIIGFRFTPEETIKYEKQRYSESERIPEEIIKLNYQKYFVKRIKQIKEFVSL